MSLKRQELSCLRSYIHQTNGLSRYFFQLWDTYYFSDHSKLFAHNSELESGFIFQRDQYLTLAGNLTFQEFSALRWEHDKLILNFDQNHWPLITSLFDNFRPTDETGDQNKIYNRFFVMRMYRDQWNMSEPDFGSVSSIGKILMVTPDREFDELKQRTFDIPGLSSIPTVLLFDAKNSEPAAFARIPTILSKDVCKDDEWSFGVIRDVWVRPTHRRRGYASIVMDRALQWLFEEHHLAQAFLYVESTNAPAVALYKKLGWQKAEEVLSCFAG
ncbi:MAG: GNAT family N-acetyltransferase [Candidatus Hodarchaeales archaeon]|jgi:ribosomal protein S18 acetylase RimI-like enzyme